jgi:hypothetical protein
MRRLQRIFREESRPVPNRRKVVPACGKTTAAGRVRGLWNGWLGRVAGDEWIYGSSGVASGSADDGAGGAGLLDVEGWKMVWGGGGKRESVECGRRCCRGMNECFRGFDIEGRLGRRMGSLWLELMRSVSGSSHTCVSAYVFFTMN